MCTGSQILYNKFEGSASIPPLSLKKRLEQSSKLKDKKNKKQMRKEKKAKVDTEFCIQGSPSC